MATKIIVAGGTGNLGEKIINALVKRGAEVHALVRASSDKDKQDQLRQLGVTVIETDMQDVAALTKACVGAACVVSALQGLEDVIVTTQTALLEGAIAAGVPRFIPSDFSVDFTKLPEGENRNFDLRRTFHKRLAGSSISPTSIFNGAFADILTYNTPMLDIKKKSIGYWGSDADWHLDFTTTDDTAAFTAAAALDATTPRYLNIASFQVSPNQLVSLTGELTESSYTLTPMGTLESFAAYNKSSRAADPEGEKELYPRWQSGQYMHDQFSSHHQTLHNNRYPDIQWTTAKEFIGSIL